jgi:hypothetical protein
LWIGTGMPNSAAILTLSNWTEAEARQRIAKLLATGWSVSSIALMFGIDSEEVHRLAGHSEAETMSEIR